MLVYITSLIVVGGTFWIQFIQVIVSALWCHTVLSVGAGDGNVMDERVDYSWSKWVGYECSWLWVSPRRHWKEVEHSPVQCALCAVYEETNWLFQGPQDIYHLRDMEEGYKMCGVLSGPWWVGTGNKI